MIRFICPTCDKHLSVLEEKAGKIAVCPGCQTRIIIPEAEPEPEAEAITAEPPRSHRRDEFDDDDDRPRRRRDEDDDDFEESDRPRRRRRRRKRKKKLLDSGGHLLIAGFYVSPYLIVMTCLLVIALPLLALSFIIPGIGYLALFIGVLMWLAGRIWFLAVAFSDDATQGIMCLWCGPYNFVYLFLNFEDARRPFFLEISGDVIATIALFTTGILS